MPEIFFEVFKEKGDHDKWHKQIEYIEKSDDWSDEEKVEIKDAIIFLSSILSRGFLKNTHYYHPIKHAINNKARHSIKWIVWISQTLKKFKENHKNFEELLDKVKRLDRAKHEGIPFLELADELAKQGFLIDFEPEIPNFNKNPDIKIKNRTNEEELYLEVTYLRDNSKNKTISSNYMALQHYTMGKGVFITGKIFSIISKNEMIEVKQLIDAKIKECVETKKIITIDATEANNLLSIAMGTNYELLKSWIKSYNKSKGDERYYEINNIASMNIDLDKDINRIISKKIKNKAKQIPQNKLGMIYLSLNPIFFIGADLAELIIRVKEKLLVLPNIAFIVLWADMIGSLNDRAEKIEIGNDRLYYIRKFKLRERTKIVICNDETIGRISDDTKFKLYKSFEEIE
jgi:hypothetical protein